jgi:hypothetical protein
MPDLVIQVAGLGGLLVLTALGSRRWIRGRGLARPAQALLGLLLVTAAGGLLGGIGWWLDDPRSFPWDLPPLAARLLAAAGWAFAVPTVLALQRPTPLRVRVALLLLVAYLAPLLVAIPLFHRDRFDWAAPITGAFFAIVLGLLVPAGLFLGRPPRVVAAAPGDGDPPNRWVQGWLGIMAGSLGAWGAALFLTDQGPIPGLWLWPGDLLTSRLIAVMLGTLAVGAVYGARYQDPARVLLGMAIVYGGGGVLATLWSAWDQQPIRVVYLGAFALLGGLSGLVLIARAGRSLGAHKHRSPAGPDPP